MSPEIYNPTCEPLCLTPHESPQLLRFVRGTLGDIRLVSERAQIPNLSRAPQAYFLIAANLVYPQPRAVGKIRRAGRATCPSPLERPRNTGFVFNDSAQTAKDRQNGRFGHRCFDTGISRASGTSVFNGSAQTPRK